MKTTTVRSTCVLAIAHNSPSNDVVNILSHAIRVVCKLDRAQGSGSLIHFSISSARLLAPLTNLVNIQSKYGRQVSR